MAVPTQNGHGEPLLDAAQLAAALGQTRRWVYRQTERGLPRYVIGRSSLFTLSAVIAWIESQRVGDWQPTDNPDPAQPATGVSRKCSSTKETPAETGASETTLPQALQKA